MSVVRFGSSTGGFRKLGAVRVRKGQTIVMQPSRVKKLERKVRKINRTLNAELRQRVVTSAAVALTQAGASQLLNGMARGDDVNEREGQSVLMRHLDLRIAFEVVNASMPQTNAGASARIMIVYDKQPNASAITTTDLLRSGGTASANYFAEPNWDFRKRFMILYDRNVLLNPSANERAPVTNTDRYDFAPKLLRIRKRLNKVVQFNDGNAGTIADIIKGSLYAFCFSSADANQWTVRFYGRTVYTP